MHYFKRQTDMTADYEARGTYVGVEWDHHAQDVFMQLN